MIGDNDVKLYESALARGSSETFRNVKWVDEANEKIIILAEDGTRHIIDEYAVSRIEVGGEVDLRLTDERLVENDE